MSAAAESRSGEPTLAHAIALGLLHGPSELLPISSSGHTTLVPWLFDWRYAQLDGDVRKSLEVALHTGTAIALLADPPWSSGTRTRMLTLACAIGPPALAGYALAERIEQRLGTPPTIAAGLLAGSLAMAVGELRCSDSRGAAQATAGDGLLLGAAQALALIPGVSRSGLATAVARARGFRRIEADRLSWQAGLPVIAGAAALQASRLARRGVPAGHARALLAGGIAAAASTCLSARLLTPDRRMRMLTVAIGYRAILAGQVARRIRAGRDIRRTGQRPPRGAPSTSPAPAGREVAADR